MLVGVEVEAHDEVVEWLSGLSRREVRSLKGERDAIITRGAGDWAAVEIKLGCTDAIASAVESLRRSL